MTLEDIYKSIDIATAPERMSKRKALDFLEELSAEIEGRLDALKEELEDE